MLKHWTEKQAKYYDEVIRLHYEEGYGEDRIAKILPIGHTTANRWIANFAAENGQTPRQVMKQIKQTKQPAKPEGDP